MAGTSTITQDTSITELAVWCQTARKLVLGDSDREGANASAKMKRATQRVTKGLLELEERDSNKVTFLKHRKRYQELAEEANKLVGSNGDKAERKKKAEGITQQLNKLAEEIQKDLKKLPNTEESKPKSQEYAKAKRKLLDQVNEARQMRGAGTDNEKDGLMELIDGALKAIEHADRLMDGGKDSKKAALKLLAEQNSFLDRAKVRAKQLKSLENKELEAATEYWSAYNALAMAREEMATIPGAAETLRKTDELLALTRAADNGRPPMGFKDAIGLLQGKDREYSRDAQDESHRQLKDLQRNPQFVQEQTRFDQALKIYEGLHSDGLVQLQRRAAAQVIGARDPVAAMQELADTLVSANDEQTKTKNEVSQLWTEVELALEDLKKADVPEEIIKGLDETKEAFGKLFEQKDFESARRLALSTRDEAAETLKRFRESRSAWVEGQKEIEKLLAERQSWETVPSLKRFLINERGNLKDLTTQVGQTLDFDWAVAATGRAKERILEQSEWVKNNGLEGNRLTAFAEKEEAWKRAKEQVEQAIQDLQQQLKGRNIQSVPAGVADFEKQLTERGGAWQKLLKHTGENRDVLTEADNEVQKLQALREKVQKADVEKLVEEGKGADREKAQRELVASVQRQLVALEDFGLNTEKLQDDLDRLSRAPATEQTIEDLQATLKEASDKLALQSEAKSAVVLLDLQKMERELLPFFDFSGNATRFKGYYAELRSQCDDIRAMANSNDPALVLAARQQMDQLKKDLRTAQGKQTGEDGDRSGTENGKQDGKPTTFDDVDRLWTELGHKLGDDGLMRRYLRVTYFQLKKQYQDAIVLAKKSPPGVGYKALQELEGPIDQAVKDARAAKERYTGFKIFSETIDGKLEELYKRTETSFTEKTEAFREKMATRLKAAKNFARQEGQLEHALKLLREIDQEVSDLLAKEPNEARAELQRLDSEAGQEQRELRDLARVWEATVAYWEKTLLPAVKSKLAEDEKKDLTEYTDLKKAFKRTSSPLRPYLDLISKVPHKKLSANASPDMNAVRAAFGEAHRRVAMFNKTAQRLLTGADTTNVDLETDFVKLEKEWTGRISRLQVALSRLSKDLESMPVQVSPQEGNEFHLAPNQVQALQANSKLLKGTLEEFATRFAPAAFKRPFTVLKDPQTDANQRRKAREEALRTMRRLRADIVKNPLCTKLFEGAKKKLLDVDVRAEMGMVRASLKKIELAVLVGV